MFASISIWFLPESPILLIQHRKLEEVKRSLKTIAWMNDCDFEPIDSFEFALEKSQKEEKLDKVMAQPKSPRK